MLRVAYVPSFAIITIVYEVQTGEPDFRTAWAVSWRVRFLYDTSERSLQHSPYTLKQSGWDERLSQGWWAGRRKKWSWILSGLESIRRIPFENCGCGLARHDDDFCF